MKISIYTGSISNSPFIERLIHSLSEKYTILIFGNYEKNKNFELRSNIKYIFTFKNKFLKLLSVIVRSLLLLIKDYKKLKKLKTNLIDLNFLNKINILNKVLPIILHEPDILHIQWPGSLHTLKYVLNIINSKIILSLRGAQINYNMYTCNKTDELYSETFKKIDCFHAVSVNISKHLKRYNINEKKIKIIYTAVDDLIINNDKIIISDLKSKIKILAHANPLIRKGTFYLLESMSLLKKENVDFTLTLIIDESNREELSRFIFELGILDKVNLLSTQKHDIFINILKKNDLYICSSLSEGIANNVIESQAVGTPVISTNCGGMNEVIENEVNGFLIPKMDSLSIKSAIVKFINKDKEEIICMINKAKREVIKNHLQSNYSKQFEELYNL